MKIIIYKTYQAGSFHIHAGVDSTIIHVVDLNLYLYKECQGSFSSAVYGVVTNQTYIDILNGNSVNYSEIKFEKIKEFEVEDDIIIGLVEKAKFYNTLKIEVKDGIDKLID
jgi:hypothetical protein